jgi:hypothetical protein
VTDLPFPPLAYCCAICTRTSCGRWSISSEDAGTKADDAILRLEFVVPVVSEFVDDEPPREDPELEPDTAFPGRDAFEEAAAIGVDTLLD